MRPSGRQIGVVAALALVGVAVAWGLRPRETLPPNVVLIIVDTLRADHLGFYDYERETSSRLDDLVAEGAVFERAYTSAPWTAPSVSSLLTSLPVRAHGITDWDQALGQEHLTLTEVLADNGYQTAAIVSHSVLRHGMGFEQGFDIYDFTVKARGRTADVISSRHVTRQAKTALEDAEPPFFFMLHYFDPHNTYMPHKRFPFGELNVDLYDGEIAYTDDWIGRFLDALEEEGYADNTLIVFVSDHGEEFHDHGGTRHTNTLFEELVRVPLAFHGPGIAPQRVSSVVRSIDIAPTVLSLLDLPVPDAFQGQVIPLRDGRFEPGDDRVAFFETRRFANLRGVVKGDAKLIHNVFADRQIGFDLADDPKERKPLPPDPELQALLEEHRSVPVYEVESTELSEERLEELRQLGYLD